jgi:hypothetical protein
MPCRLDICSTLYASFAEIAEEHYLTQRHKIRTLLSTLATDVPFDLDACVGVVPAPLTSVDGGDEEARRVVTRYQLRDSDL